MSHSQYSEQTLNRLLDDVLSSDDVSPEQLVQYAEKPETLSDHERAFIEQRLAESPALADQFRVLNNFQPSADQAPSSAPEAQSRASLLQSIVDSMASWFTRPLMPIAAMALVAALATTVLLRIDEPSPTAPQIASSDEPTIDQPATDHPAMDPAIETPAEQPTLLADSNMDQIDPQPAEPIEQPPESAPLQQDTFSAPDDTRMLAMIEPQYMSPYGDAPQGVLRGDEPALQALAPSSANTLSPQPVLYWWLHQPMPNASLLLEISDENSGEILLSKSLAKPETRGLYKIDMAGLGLSLQENQVYQWSLILQVDENNPALDRFTGARIRYVKAGTELAGQLADSSDASRASLYASHGYWYDALDDILRLRQRYPDNASIEQAYRSLLSQAGVDIQ